MKLSDKEKQSALNEVKILASVEHQNIVGYKQAFIDEQSESLCIIMEFADKGDIQSLIESYKNKNKFIEEYIIWDIMYQMVKALQTLHHHKIVHRDIKCANVFLSSQNDEEHYDKHQYIAKLGDMNVSKINKLGIMKTQTGTPYYASPEVWQDKPYTSKCDIWSLGCVIYELASLQPPFKAKNMAQLYSKVIKGVYPRIPRHYSADLSKMICLLLSVDPRVRPSSDEIAQMPVFQRQNIDVTVQSVDSNEDQLLQTIKMPRYLKQLTDRLPTCQYDKKRRQSKCSHNVCNDTDHRYSDTTSSDGNKDHVVRDYRNSAQQQNRNRINSLNCEQNSQDHNGHLPDIGNSINIQIPQQYSRNQSLSQQRQQVNKKRVQPINIQYNNLQQQYESFDINLVRNRNQGQFKCQYSLKKQICQDEVSKNYNDLGLNGIYYLKNNCDEIKKRNQSLELLHQKIKLQEQIDKIHCDRRQQEGVIQRNIQSIEQKSRVPYNNMLQEIKEQQESNVNTKEIVMENIRKYKELPIIKRNKPSQARIHKRLVPIQNEKKDYSVDRYIQMQNQLYGIRPSWWG